MSLAVASLQEPTRNKDYRSKFRANQGVIHESSNSHCTHCAHCCCWMWRQQVVHFDHKDRQGRAADNWKHHSIPDV